jgi:hypothetical protein
MVVGGGDGPARAWALVKSIVTAHSISSVALVQCSLISWASRVSRSPVTRPTIEQSGAWRQSVEQGSMLVALPDKLATAQGGALYLVAVWRSAAVPSGWLVVPECSLVVVRW